MKEDEGGGETDCWRPWFGMGLLLTNLEEDEALISDAAFLSGLTLLACGRIWLDEGEEFVSVLMLFEGGWKSALEMPLFWGKDCKLAM